MTREQVLQLIRWFEDAKEKGDFDQIISLGGRLLIRTLNSSGLSVAQIECATREDINAEVIEEIIAAYSH